MLILCFFRYRFYATEVNQASMFQLFFRDENLKKFKGFMPSDKVVIQQLASGLEYIYSKQLAHGNIRPENVHIFIPTNSSPAVVKWAGFTLFKQLDKLGGCSLTIIVSGSLIWTAPELFLPYGALKKTQTLLSGRDFKELTYLLRVLQCSITFLVVFIHLVNDE